MRDPDQKLSPDELLRQARVQKTIDDIAARRVASNTRLQNDIKLYRLKRQLNLFPTHPNPE